MFYQTGSALPGPLQAWFGHYRAGHVSLGELGHVSFVDEETWKMAHRLAIAFVSDWGCFGLVRFIAHNDAQRDRSVAWSDTVVPRQFQCNLTIIVMFVHIVWNQMRKRCMRHPVD